MFLPVYDVFPISFYIQVMTCKNNILIAIVYCMVLNGKHKCSCQKIQTDRHITGTRQGIIWVDTPECFYSQNDMISNFSSRLMDCRYWIHWLLLIQIRSCVGHVSDKGNVGMFLQYGGINPHFGLFLEKKIFSGTGCESWKEKLVNMFCYNNIYFCFYCFVYLWLILE